MRAATVSGLASPSTAAVSVETATVVTLSFACSPLLRRHVPFSSPFLSPDILRTSRPLNRHTTAQKYLLRPSYDFRAAAAFASCGNTLVHDAGAAAAVLAGAYTLVATFDKLTQRKLIEQSLSRKLVHILSGLLFMASWPIFSTSAGARYFASIVPLINCVRLVVHGLSLAPGEALVKSVTREGNPEELLRGPLYYVLILILCAVVFWRESPIGVVSLAMMCGGDGNTFVLAPKE